MKPSELAFTVAVLVGQMETPLLEDFILLVLKTKPTSRRDLVELMGRKWSVHTCIKKLRKDGCIEGWLWPSGENFTLYRLTVKGEKRADALIHKLYSGVTSVSDDLEVTLQGAHDLYDQVFLTGREMTVSRNEAHLRLTEKKKPRTGKGKKKLAKTTPPARKKKRRRTKIRRKPGKPVG